MKGGAEIGVHSMRQYASHNHEEDKLIVKIDFSNAFNSLRRDVMMTKVKEHTPGIFQMMKQSYCEKSFLYFNHQDVILSQEGIQQGNPLSAYFFSLALMDLTKACKSELKVWYLDDGTLGGSPKMFIMTCL